MDEQKWYFRVTGGKFDGFCDWYEDGFFEIEESYKDLLIEKNHKEMQEIYFDGKKLIPIKKGNENLTMVKPVFNYNKLIWEESASKEEVEENLFKESVKFYNSELELASKATAELACEIIDQTTFEEVKTYMKSIDPYAGIKTIPEVKRPEIFKKYL